MCRSTTYLYYRDEEKEGYMRGQRRHSLTSLRKIKINKKSIFDLLGKPQKESSLNGRGIKAYPPPSLMARPLREKLFFASSLRKNHYFSVLILVDISGVGCKFFS